MKLLQINVSLNSGSHGRIAEEIGYAAIKNGNESFIAAAYANRVSQSEVIRIGSKVDRVLHGLRTRLLDRHGFGSSISSRKLITKIKKIDPDLIHLHNIHGYFLHAGLLFKYLKESKKPVVWTFHDSWPFTGHCSYFDTVNCFKWRTKCFNCPNRSGYPKSLLIDSSRINYRDKKQLFTGVNNMVLVSPSQWLAEHLRESYLKDYEIRIINNGINTENFKSVRSDTLREKYKINGKYILGVASTWSRRKGLDDLIRLRVILEPEIEIVLVGLNIDQARILPIGISSIFRTENVNELAAFYSGAEVFINPTYVDNFPSVNIEALACGTPVITYKTGGSHEAIDNNTGIIVEKGNILGLKDAISEILSSEDRYTPEQCRNRAEKYFSSEKMCRDYLNLYKYVLDIY